MLCEEGISRALKVFLGKENAPKYVLSPSTDKTLTVFESTSVVRPYAACAILRGIHFTQRRYESFISIQDKLHQNLGRQRTLISMGTHDLRKIEGPFTYQALPPEQIKFVPLNQTKEMNGRELMEFYESDRQLSRYLHIIKNSPVYPVMLDARGKVLSLPPIINSEYSKIDLYTKDVFIEITATDQAKLKISLDILVTMFSCYCTEPFTIEPVEIISKHNNLSRITPDLSPRSSSAQVSYINSCTGVNLTQDEICKNLERMCIEASPDQSDLDKINVLIPVTRADILHQCDLMEDVAIAYGFNKLPRPFPSKVATVGGQSSISKLADIVRQECAIAGWTETLTLILCSRDENYAWLRKSMPKGEAVELENPKTLEYQIARTSLLPGLLKTVRENKKYALPLKLFEVSDVVFQDLSRERASRNERHMAALWCGTTSGFEAVHGLLDRIMAMLQVKFIDSNSTADKGYWVEEGNGKKKIFFFFFFVVK